MTELDLKVVDELLSTTRSVRKRLDLERPVAPTLIDECLELSLQAPTGGNASLYGSILPAVWSFMPAARARNLGTVLTTLHLKLETEAAHLLGVPDSFLQVGLIPVAHTDPAVFKPVSRQPLASVRFHDRWPVEGLAPPA